MRKGCVSFILALALFPGLAGDLDRSVVPQAGPAPEIKLGDFAFFELENGLRVFVVENHKLPRVAFSLMLEHDPVLEGEAAGYVRATGEMLRRGTKTRTKAQIDEAIDFVGARLFTADSMIFAASLKKHGETVLELMADMALNAEFRQEELDKIKKTTLSELQAGRDDPNTIAQRLRNVLAYGKDHPYGEVQTEATTDKISLELCRTYYKNFFRPNIAYLAVVGDITEAEARPLVEKYFGTWQRGPVPTYTYPNPVTPSQTSVAVVHKEGAVQTVLEVLHPVILKPGSPDAIKASVANTVLGGGTFRLYNNLREDKGYTYGAFSNLRKDRLVGEFVASCSVRNEVTAASVQELLFEMNRIRDELVPAEELSLVKNFMNGNFARSLEDPQTIARFAVNTARYDLGDDYYSNYLKTLAGVTSADVQAMARDFFLPKRSWVLAVGDADVLISELASVGPVHRFDIYGNPVKPATVELPEGLTVQAVFEAYLKASGGREKLQTVKQISTEGSFAVGGMNLVYSSHKKAPNKSVTVLSMEGNEVMRSVFDGQKGAQINQGMKVDFDEDGLKRARVEAQIFLELDTQTLGITTALAGVDMINASPAYKVELTLPGGAEATRHYDVKSGLLVQASSTMETPQGPMTQIVEFSQYRDVDGISYPHAIIINMGQRMEIQLKKVAFNAGLEDTLFQVD